MILSSLCEYHAIMERRGEVLREGYSALPMKFLVCLTPEGEIDAIIDRGETENGKRTYPEMLLPLRTQKTSIDANIIEHRPLYLFGLVCRDGAYHADDAKAQKSITAHRRENLAFFAGLVSPVAQAYRNFILRWDPAKECENRYLLAISKEYAKGYFAFCLSGDPAHPLHEDAEVQAKWEAVFSARAAESDAPVAQCPVYGENLPVARLHNKIKGIKGGQPSGCSLVCFNNESENSYGKEQSYNSSVSERAMKAYTEALNYLLADARHRTYLGGMTVVHFALAVQEEPYLKGASVLFEEPPKAPRTTEGDVERSVGTTMQKIAVGQKPSFDVPDANVEYCIFGLVPNSSRVAVKFGYRNTFGVLRRNVERYHRDFAIGNVTQAPPVWKICKQLVSPKSKEEPPTDLEGEMLASIIGGTPFPYKVLALAVQRVRTDQDEEKNHFIKLNDTRAGLIKACLNQRKKFQEDPITMALDPNRKDPAYLCGRMFAALEKLQQDRTRQEGGELNKTIKESFFASACATPALVFPRLVRLAQAHLAKLREGSKTFYAKLLGEISEGLSAFPKTLSLEEQGLFILGYYHQNRAFYQNKEDQTEEK